MQVVSEDLDPRDRWLRGDKNAPALNGTRDNLRMAMTERIDLGDDARDLQVE